MTDLQLDASNRRTEPVDHDGTDRPRRRLWPMLLLALLVTATLLGLFYLGTGYGYAKVTPAYLGAHEASSSELVGAQPDSPIQTAEQALKVIEKTEPKGVFIVVDRVQNRLHLREGDQTLLTAIVSAGAGSTLEDPSGKRSWVFDTPIGRFFVKDKRQDPTWTAPDWDYIENGEPYPKRYSDRVQEGMLGEYAFDLGGGPTGYMIHGTLYTRLLGRNVSHGCIRVGRDDLRVLWKKVPVGSTVYMY